MIHQFFPGVPGSPTLLLLHGTGGDENSLIGLGEELLPGASLLSVRGAVQENGMNRFFVRLSEGVFDLKDLALRTQELYEFLEDSREAYNLRGPIIAVGYSNGANIAANLLLNYGDALQGAVLLRGLLPDRPHSPTTLSGVPVLIQAGLHDTMINPDLVKELSTQLTKIGADVTLNWEHASHGLTQNDISITKTWLSTKIS